jgi:hypothetical protein
MNIQLSLQESESYFHNALCNAVGTGYMESYGLKMKTKKEEYVAAKSKLQSPSYEDVLIQILKDGGSLTFKDLEGDNTKTIALKEVHDRVQLTPLSHLTNMIDGTDDASTADAILQTVFFEEIIFG